MIKIDYDKSLFKGYSGLCESIFCAPFEDPSKFEEEEFENRRWDDLIKNGNQYLSIDEENCDYIIVPYKWDNLSQNTKNILDNASSRGKKVISLHNDDFSPSVPLREDLGYLFTTTLIRGSKRKNEFSFPAFTGDFYCGNECSLNRTIGFCGAITNQIRSVLLDMIQRSFLKKDIVIRSGFWAPELSKMDARKEYFDNIQRNTFTLCMRGAGNFSYRFYESLMMGRIPIIIDSFQIFPFESVIDYSEFSIRIPIESIGQDFDLKLKSIIDSLSDSELKRMQLKSREIWIEYMSPLGWIKNFTKELK